jgi:hypothetical protein
MWRTQALPLRASATITFFFLEVTVAKTACAIAFGLEPFSQLSVQKKVDFPFPRV